MQHEESGLEAGSDYPGSKEVWGVVVSELDGQLLDDSGEIPDVQGELVAHGQLDDYRLDDCFRRTSGRVFVTGTQALTLIMLMQRRLDDAAGLKTAGFVSGYRGSPLGAMDLSLWRAKEFLEEARIRFLPAVNEDLAATAVLGTQQVEIESSRQVDGVYSMWYGKGPGVDRAGDALKHGNAYGSSKNGGVLVVAGDDHGCVSSSMSHQSDVAFMALYIPTLHPANIAEYVEFGLWGFAASRFSGLWVGFKAISETVESAASIDLPGLPSFAIPDEGFVPVGGMNYRWPDLPGMQIETRMRSKKEAILAFARSNPIDRTIYNTAGARFGIVTTGKAHLDVMEALRLLGIDEKKARQLGIDVYKVGLVWPLETQGAANFMVGKEEIIVVEEKRGVIESQLKEYLYDKEADKPKRILGKHDEKGSPLVDWVEELSPCSLIPILSARIRRVCGEAAIGVIQDPPADDASASVPELEAVRRPFFCSGCPHNTSTRVPEGSRALAGIGCHFMASWMDRNTSDLIQMGGEGVNWAAKSMFMKDKHVFQNLGDGTYYHSGYMAIRQSIAAGANITYKILYNDAVAMTGGQPVDGVLTVPRIAAQVRSEGVKKIVVVSDDPGRTAGYGAYPPNVDIRPREDLDMVQRQIREEPGVSVLIYDQTCALEKRKRRKRGAYPDPAKWLFINESVCEGCGDCSVQSNCLSIVPSETRIGTKRRIDQASCNKDYSCVKGFCPSFVTVEGGTLRKAAPRKLDQELVGLLSDLPVPPQPAVDGSFDLLIAGVGGTGVVTIGAVVTMAAHLEGKGASVLDFTGFAQKGGAVLSYVRIGAKPTDMNQVRIDVGCAEAAIVCDLIVGTDTRALRAMRRHRTGVIANNNILPSGDFIHNRSIDFQEGRRIEALKDACGDDRVDSISATHLAKTLLGDPVYANMMLLGYTWQKGLVPVRLDAIDRAIELNGVSVEKNRLAFALGRAALVNGDAVQRAAGAQSREQSVTRDPEAFLDEAAKFLTNYQNGNYAASYLRFVREIADKAGTVDRSGLFVETVARNLLKLMSYKDEYEVARLYTDGTFAKSISEQFDGPTKIKFHLAPPIFGGKLDPEGRPMKIEFGSWMYYMFGILAKGKVLRGTWFDPFGRIGERKIERALIVKYLECISDLADQLSPKNLETAVEIAGLPDSIRGYGVIKMNAIKAAEQRQSELLKTFAQAENPDLLNDDRASIAG